MDVFNKVHIRTQKRDAIVKVAGKLFCSLGFNAVSIDHIAGNLGVAKTVIYSHFENKVDLFKACHMASTELLESALAASRSNDPLERVLEFVQGYVPALIGGSGPGAVLLDLEILPDNMGQEIRARRDSVYKKIEEWLAEAAAQYSDHTDQPSVAIFTKILLGGINVLPKWYEPNDQWTPEMVADSICRTVRGWVHEPRICTGAAKN